MLFFLKNLNIINNTHMLPIIIFILSGLINLKVNPPIIMPKNAGGIIILAIEYHTKTKTGNNKELLKVQ